MHIFPGFCIYFSQHDTPTWVAKYEKEKTAEIRGWKHFHSSILSAFQHTLTYQDPNTHSWCIF